MAHLGEVLQKLTAGRGKYAPAVPHVAVGRVVWAIVHFAHKRRSTVRASAAVDPPEQARCLAWRRHARGSGNQI